MAIPYDRFNNPAVRIGPSMRLIAEGLAVTRGGRPVFAGLSFTLASGGLLAVTGPNGAGKSTLLRVVAGLLRAEAGTIVLEPADDAGVQGAVHYLGHGDALKPSLTVHDNLAFWSQVWGGGDVPAALDAVGLGHLAGLPAGVLSAGQRRRVAIARLLLVQRPVWLLDEPATALDAAAEDALGRLIASHIVGGGIAIVATHRDLPVPPTQTLRLGTA